MLFTDFAFFILLAITFLLYYLPGSGRFQILLLIVSSLVFYGFYNPYLTFILVASFLMNAIVSYLIQYGDITKKRLIATTGIVLNLGLLCYYKYSPLIGRTFFADGNSLGEFLISVPLPIGISFFTFEGISLLTDTFRSDKEQETKKIYLERNFLLHLRNTALFVSFFPHLVAGPILKAYEYLPQIKQKYFVDIKWEKAVKFLIIGFFLKCVIADNLKEQTMYMRDPYFYTIPTVTLLAMLYGYSMQIFSDFAGYSSIALGLALLFGYEINKNFDFPYISTSFSEFWRRWHISLSTFLKEYVYIPLGGNKAGKFRTYLNLFLVMLLGGLWHGANWSFAVWGGLHGMALALERLWKEYFPKAKAGKVTSFLNGLMVFSVVTLLWLTFKFPEFSHVIGYLNAIIANTGIGLGEFWKTMMELNILYSIPVILYHAYYLYRNNNPDSKLIRYEDQAYACLLFLIITNSGISGDFIYFQF